MIRSLAASHSSLRQWMLPGLLVAALALLPLAPSRASEEEQDANAVTVGGQADRAIANGYRSSLNAEGLQQVTTNFRSLRGDPLSLSFMLSPVATRQSVAEFGVSVEELDALLKNCRDRLGCDQAEFDRHTSRYYQQHALKLSYREGGPRLHVDVAQVVQRNRERVRPVAVALRRLAAERGEGQEWMVETAIALVQDGLVYRKPATWDGGRKILGFYPPLRALERGYGDCDTKAALLAAILQNLTSQPMVGVHVPKHYLLGIAGTPRQDQSYILHAGKPYVLVEAAGPARRAPGEVAPTTHAALKKNEGVRVDPMI